MSGPNFFAELKRRNVYKVAVAYAVVAWLLIQAASILFPTFEVPAWAMKVLVVLLAAGFVVALVVAWAFEMTPEGMKRTEEVSPNERIPYWSRRKFAALIVIDALAAGGLLLYQVVGIPQSRDRAARGNEDGGRSAASLPVPEKSIAVLPFVNMSSDKENEYFVDGLTEEILNRLAQISALRVPGRTSSFAFKGKNTDLRQIGTELGVAHVLEGSVRKSEGRLRITSQLIRTADGFHLWSETFDRKLDDVFAIQEEIARAIADALSAPLGLSEPVNPQRQTKDMDAYDKFLQARALIAQRNPQNLRRALELLTSAVDRDPRFASGWAALAQARALSSYYLSDIADPLKSAEEAARKALALDDSIAMAHSALADVLRDRRDWLAAESEYARALKLSPGEAETHNQYAQMLLKVGRIDGALEHALRACELEPLGWVPPSVASLAYLSRGDLVQTRTYLDRSEKLSGHTRGFQSRMELMFALCQRDPALARRALTLVQQATWAPDPPSPEIVVALDQALAGFQNSSAAPLDLGKPLKDFGPSGRVPLSAVAAFIGQKEVALDAIALEAELAVIDTLGLIWTPVYHPLRNEPRFLEFLRKMKMPEYWRTAGWSDFCQPRGENDFECK
jgi:TolB-like protein/Tfp pilus assembly protein PilF